MEELFLKQGKKNGDRNSKALKVGVERSPLQTGRRETGAEAGTAKWAGHMAMCAVMLNQFRL